METFIVDNIVFYDRNLAMQAEKEWKKVKLLQEKLDEKNMANVAVMYQKAVELFSDACWHGISSETAPAATGKWI